MQEGRRVAIIGAGWAGLAAAVRARARGHEVTVFEMSRHPGGRARGVDTAAGLLDNGQHILIGAYVQTLALMRDVGADPDVLLVRQPLCLAYPDGRGLRLPPGAPILSFARAVCTVRSWSAGDRLRLLRTAAGWGLRGFRCHDSLTVERLCTSLPIPVVKDLIEPLCVAALNTPMAGASAKVFLRVLRDALFSGPGSADLLLPRRSLSALLPDPAVAWLATQGASLHWGRRAVELLPQGAQWSVEGELFDRVVMACSAREAARLARVVSPAWSAQAASLGYEPIITAYLRDEQLRLPESMMALDGKGGAPAQFVFDLGALGRQAGMFAFVASGAARWVEHGQAAVAAAVLDQARRAFPGHFDGADDAIVAHLATEHRATFACTPGLSRPGLRVAPGLLAAGDYIEGPYPATLEGAVRSGEAAAALL